MRSRLPRKEQNTWRVYLCERRNETSYADEPSVSKQPGHLCDAADVFLAVPSRETQVFIQAMPNIITIQGIAGDAMRDQVLFQSKADGCLASSRKAWWRQKSEVQVWGQKSENESVTQYLLGHWQRNSFCLKLL